MKSIGKKAGSPVEGPKDCALSVISHGRRMRYVRPVLKGNDWFSWTKAVAADVRSRHNGTCRVTVTLLTPIRSDYRIVTRTISYARSRGASASARIPNRRNASVVKAASAPKCGTVIRSRV